VARNVKKKEKEKEKMKEERGKRQNLKLYCK
jgi:hypothetical protein